MPTYTSETDPYWRHRKLRSFADVMQRLAYKKQEDEQIQRRKDEWLVQQAEDIARTRGPNDPAIEAIRQQISPKNRGDLWPVLDSLSALATEAENYQRKQALLAITDQNKLDEQQSLTEFLQFLDQNQQEASQAPYAAYQPGISQDALIRRSLEQMPPSQRFILQGGMPTPPDPMKHFPMAQRPLYQPGVATPGEQRSAARYGAQLEATPEEKRRERRQKRRLRLSKAAGERAGSASERAERRLEMAEERHKERGEKKPLPEKRQLVKVLPPGVNSVVDRLADAKELTAEKRKNLKGRALAEINRLVQSGLTRTEAKNQILNDLKTELEDLGVSTGAF